MDPHLLARLQFAANISFHILFPSITLTLCWFLLFFKLAWNRTGNPGWMEAYRFFTKVFALSFALGVVSGVTMSFQFGTNWPGFMEKVGNVAGPLLAYEVLTAFFLEASFLSVMLFGIGRVSNRVHTMATVLVAVGTSLSAFWILVLNSWMQTPAGFEIRDGVVHATDWLAIIFNPSMPYRITHMVLASGLTASFVVAGLSAFRWLRGERGQGVMLPLRTAVTVAAVLIPVQMVVGDQHGLNTLHHQPEKIAAVEAIWETEQPVALRLFAIPDEATRTNLYEIAIPHLGSLILTHTWAGGVKGLNEFQGQYPPVAPVFFAFRIMVGMGMLMLATSWWAVWSLRRGGPGVWVARLLALMTFSGWVATLSGWYVTEIGRQPWLVTGVLRTVDAAGPVPAGTIGLSLAMYLVLYAFLLAAYILTILHLATKAGAPGPVPAAQPQAAE